MEKYRKISIDILFIMALVISVIWEGYFPFVVLPFVLMCIVFARYLSELRDNK